MGARSVTQECRIGTGRDPRKAEGTSGVKYALHDLSCGSCGSRARAATIPPDHLLKSPRFFHHFHTLLQ